MFLTSAMNVLITAAVSVMLPCCGVLGSSLDTALSDEVASLLGRMKAQESLNRELTTKLLYHEDKLTQQENLNRELKTHLLRYTENLSQQENLNKELKTKLLRNAEKLSQQDSLNRDLRTRMARQDGTLLQQSRLIQQLRSAVTASRASAAVSRASATVSRAPATVSRASATVGRASATISRASAQEDVAPTLRHVNTVDVMGVPDSAVLGRIVANRSDSAPNVAKRSAAVQNVAKQSDSGHHVVKRSDDGGPLEAVVNQISQRVTEMGAELQALKTQTTNIDRQQDQNIHDARTSTFVRWGSSTCGDSSSLVYSGVVGGSWYEDAGAATNSLCLTLSPVPSQRAFDSTYVAHLFGTEYETQDSYQNRDTLCAVCRAAFSTTVMVPGTDTCSPGWHRHYSGFLMAGWYGHAAGTQYICVDAALESAPHGDANDNGNTLFYTVTRCGSLPCGPYVNDKVVTCAVCSM